MNRFVSIAALATALALAPAARAQTAGEADAFIAQVEKDAAEISLAGAQAAWVNETYITDDTDAISARISAQATQMAVGWAKQAARFDHVAGLSPDTQRKLYLLKIALTLPAPETPGAAQELSRISTALTSAYGKGKGTLDGQPINGSDIEAAMGTTRDPARLKEMWTSWNDNVGAPMKDDYAKLVAITNQGREGAGLRRCRRDVARGL